MEGPTPVSALIHAATMVTAGVYLVVRLHALYILTPDVLLLIGIVGGATALYAALSAVGQTDLKRVLAYSTVSQLGLMFLACGVGAFYTAMFHLTMHAFMKALLFLSAGNVVHMMHGTTEMDKMGGLRKVFTKTQWLFLIGVLAMSGIPPLAAFFSKDLILEVESILGYRSLLIVGVAASMLTGFYLVRAYCLTFLGKSKSEDVALHKIQEAPQVMILPVSLLALLSIFGGFLGYSFGKLPPLEYFLSDVGLTRAEIEITTGPLINPSSLWATAIALVGVISAAIIYTLFVDKLGKPLAILKKAFFLNEIYAFVLVTPLKTLAQYIADFVEPKVFDGSRQTAVKGTQNTAIFLQKGQSGQIRSYVAWMALGSSFLIGYLAL
jgi:NADH-quinone oxidoreductase subunit L